jgi:hypothetical protein
MNVTGTNVAPSASFPGVEGGTTVTLSEGSYSVDESTVSGYTKSIGSDCSGSIANGETKTCTITNDDQAGTLIVKKHVINDNGGAKVAGDFTMNVTGTNVAPSASFPGVEGGTTVTLSAGSYSVDESTVSGYTKSIGSDCSGNIANGETKTCTITNDDQAATLIVIKHVINNNGLTAVASQFTMSVTGDSPSPSSFSGAESPGTAVSLKAGGFSVSESGPSGYTQTSAVGCTGTIANGETKTCTITNDDNPNTPVGTTVQRWVLHDFAKFTILANAPGTPAKVQFSLYRDNDGVFDAETTCGTGGTLVGTAEEVTINQDGEATTVNGFPVTTSGLYAWIANYSGDQYNNSASTGCGSEITLIKAQDLTHNDTP